LDFSDSLKQPPSGGCFSAGRAGIISENFKKRVLFGETPHLFPSVFNSLQKN